MGCVFIFICWHSAHPWMNLLTNRLICGHQTFRCKMAKVLKIPGCPYAGESCMS